MIKLKKGDNAEAITDLLRNRNHTEVPKGSRGVVILIQEQKSPCGQVACIEWDIGGEKKRYPAYMTQVEKI